MLTVKSLGSLRMRLAAHTGSIPGLGANPVGNLRQVGTVGDRKIKMVVSVGQHFLSQTILKTKAGVSIYEGRDAAGSATTDDVVSIEEGSGEVSGHRHSDRC